MEIWKQHDVEGLGEGLAQEFKFLFGPSVE